MFCLLVVEKWVHMIKYQYNTYYIFEKLAKYDHFNSVYYIIKESSPIKSKSVFLAMLFLSK